MKPCDTSTTPEADAKLVAQGFITNVLPAFTAATTSDTQFLGVRAQRINNTGGPSYAYALGTSTQGLLPVKVDNSRVAAVLIGDYYNSPAPQPKWRSGKIFVGGVPTNGMVENSWTIAQANLLLAIGTALATNFGSSPVGPFDNGIWSPLYNTFFSVLWELSPNIGSLKRRLKPSP
jgi:hypothetical protein